MQKDTLTAVKQAYEIESQCIASMLDYLDVEQFSKAVELLKNAPRIGTCGCGHSGIICQHLAHLLCCIEQPARFISPAEAVHGATGFLQEGDVMVFASRGGKTKELLPIIDICKAKGVKIISITENMESPLAVNADAVIKQYVNRETDKYNSQGTTSTTALCMICHALQTALIEETGFKNEQFALIHPGGAVGERLNKKEFNNSFNRNDKSENDTKKTEKLVVKEKIIRSRRREYNVPLEYIYDVGLKKNTLSNKLWLKYVKDEYKIGKSSAYQWNKVAELVRKNNDGKYYTVIKGNSEKDYNYSQLSKLLEIYKDAKSVMLAAKDEMFNVDMTAEEMEKDYYSFVFNKK